MTLRQAIIGASLVVASVTAVATPAFARGQTWATVPERGQTWLAPVAAATECPAATSHLWCGLANNDGSYDHTYPWWELGLAPIINHGHLPEQALIGRTPVAGYGTGPVTPPRS